MKKIARLAIVVGAIVIMAHTIAQAGTLSVKTEDCTLTEKGGTCECTVNALTDLSMTSVYVNNAASPGTSCVANDCGFSIVDLSLTGDQLPGAANCDLSGIGRNNRGWFDIPRRIAQECGSAQAYSPIPLERRDSYVITLRGFNRQRGRDCRPAPVNRCQNDILVDVRVSAHGNFSLTCVNSE